MADIVKWKQTECDRASFPVQALVEWAGGVDSKPEVEIVKIGNGESADLKCGPLAVKGVMDAFGMFHIGTMSCKGSGSGEFFNNVLEPLLHECSGNMEALVHWEGESNPVKLTVENGDVYEVFVN